MANDETQASQPRMERWEYYVHTYEKVVEMQEDLDNAGREGWEAVSVSSNTVPRSGGGQFAITFQATLWTVVMKRRLS